MAAIPVPVHFDGHNINIITEDSPSTCKNRTKGVNYGKKNNNKGKKRNFNQNGKYPKTQILNKRLPTSTNQNSKINSTTDSDSKNNGTLIISPISSSQKDISPSNKENIDELNPISNNNNNNNNNLQNKKPPCPLPIVPKINKNMTIESEHMFNNMNVNTNKILPSLPLPPPPIPLHPPQSIGHNNNAMNNNIKPKIIHHSNNNSNALNRISASHTASSKQDIIAEQNKQLIAGGLDPNEFGSHDDVGFDDDDSGNGNRNNNGKDRQNLYKTELCREWSTSGWCYYNKRCSFAHGLQELRPVFRSKKWRTKRCRNWHTTGYCPYEHRCQFLHDQSPPRRISDYATANARALVAAQQRMQPLYFHYQVDCNRDETSDDDLDKKSSNLGNSKPNTPTIKSQASPRARSLGPRFKSKNKNKNKPKTPKTPGSHQSYDSQNNNIKLHGQNYPSSAIRMIPQRKNNKNKNDNNALRIIPQRNKNHKNKNRKNKQNKPKTPKSGQNNISKSKKKKQKKDAVITPFNPVSSTYPGGMNINNLMGNMSNVSGTYEQVIAAQQLGLYNPTMNNSIAAAAAAMGSIIPPLPMSTMPSTFQALPPSIDPSLYLSLTPSPPTSPHTGSTNAIKIQSKNNKNHQNNNKLAVEVPVSLTPSPPSLPTAAIHPLTHLNINTPNGAALSHQQIGIELVKQQQTLAALHEKVQQVAQQQAAQQAEQQAAVQALLARNVINKSNTPIAPIDGGLLESLLPTNDDTKTNDKNTTSDKNSIKSDGNINNPSKSANNKASLPRSAPNNNDKTNSATSTTSDKPSTNTKTLPPIPPIPPPLQLQTSINSVVTGAVAAAMYSAPNTKQTPNSAHAPNFGFNHNNINVNVALNTTPTIPQSVASTSSTNPSYVQQAHAHAHAYASTHTKLNNLNINNNNVNVPYAPYPNYQQIPHQLHHNHHQLQGLQGSIQPLQQLQHLQGSLPMQPMQTHIGYPPFYAPSPDFQEIPQQQYYNTNYTHHQTQRHHY